jgi:hypothetical protein
MTAAPLRPQLVRRDKLACEGCGREVARRARQQRFCSARCKETGRTRIRAIASRPTIAPIKNNERAAVSAHALPEKFNETKRAQTRIRGPVDVLDVEVWRGRDWQPAISSGGVAIVLGRLRARALVTP